MKYIAIHQTVKDIQAADPILSQLPSNYPLQCTEFESQGDALASYPNALIMTINDYNVYKTSFQAAYDAAAANPLKS